MKEKRKYMNFRFLCAIALCSALCVEMSAQSASEIAAAKSVARSYGYTDSQVDAFLNGNSTPQSTVQTSTRTTVQSPTPNTMQPSLQTVVLPPDQPAVTFQEVAYPYLELPTPDEAVSEGENEIYGHSYFKSQGLARIPSYNAPAPDGYVLGPGDEVVLDIWGSTVSHIVATVSPDGGIIIPDVGPIYVSGMTIKAAEQSLKSQLSRIYSGLSDGETYMSLSVGKIRGVVVNVSGAVNVPGAYTIPSMAAIPSAIYAAGGLTDNGSVRNIGLYRGGKLVATFDLYELIFKGKVDDKLRIQDGDIISVPAYDSVVRITGAVMRPKRYELKKGENIDDVIGFAQGFKTNSQRSSVNVSRIEENGGKSFDVASSAFKSFSLKDGDEINVRSFAQINTDRISIKGPVKYPGAYSLGSGVSDVASLIKAAGGLIEGAYTGKGQLTRLDANRQPEFRVFDLSRVMDGSEYIALKREDVVVLYSFDDFSDAKVVSIVGAVNNPGRYTVTETMTLSSLINKAGGLTPTAYLAGGKISREGSDGRPVIVPVDIQKAISGESSVILQPGDAVAIYDISELKKYATVSINGEVNAPGSYVFREGMTLSDLLDMAQGCTHGADLSNLEIASRGGKERGQVMNIDTEANPSYLHLTLKPYDMVSVRRLTYFRPQIAVTVSGEVAAPGTYVIDKPQVRLSDVLNRVGGFTDDAYIHGAKLVRVLTEDEMERQKMALALAARQVKQSNQGGMAALAGLDTLRLEDRFSIGIDLEQAMAAPGCVSDVILRAGDIIEVPQMNNTVKISGGVLYPNIVAFNEKSSWQDYISQAGGYTKLARTGKVFAVYMNGQVAKKSKIVAEPGMELIVPERDPSEEHKLSPGEIAAMASSTTSIAALVMSIIRML